MHSALPKKYVLFTGVTSGIGHAMIQEFTRNFNNKFYLYYIIACRCMKRGGEIKAILDKMENVEVTLVKIDISDVAAVMRGCDVIKRKFPRIDGMYLNAGIMPVASIRFGYFFKSFFNGDIWKIISNGEGLFRLEDVAGPQGLPTIFATNVLGHFIMVRELKENLENRSSKKDETAKIIWTSSMSSNEKHFDMDDVMACEGPEPYASSKYAVDTVAQAWNDQFQDNKVQSLVVDPGTVLTNLMTSFLPLWFLYFVVVPCFFILRVFNSSNNIHPDNAASAFIEAFTATEEPQQVDYRKLCSSTSIRGCNFVRRVPLPSDGKKCLRIFKQIQSIAKRAIADLHDNHHHATE